MLLVSISLVASKVFKAARALDIENAFLEGKRRDAKGPFRAQVGMEEAGPAGVRAPLINRGQGGSAGCEGPGIVMRMDFVSGITDRLLQGCCSCLCASMLFVVALSLTAVVMV